MFRPCNRRSAIPVSIIIAIIVVSSLFLFTARHETIRETVSPLRIEPDTYLKQTDPVLNRKLTGMTEFREQIDDSGAVTYLQTYYDKFAKNRKTADLTPNVPASITEWWQAAAMIDWYINSPLRYKCGNKRAYGNWHVCQDKEYEVKPPCLVYSFGINNDFSFDDAMGKLGCEVHSFDPSMGQKSHRRSANVTFYDIGLSSFNSDGYIARQDLYVQDTQIWKMRTVKHIKNMLGHQNRVIDVLKMDVEGYEWAVLDNMLETDMFDYIRQYMLEFHLFPKFPLKEEYVYCYNTYRRLREKGLREFNVGPHPKTLKYNKFNNQGDSEYVNVNFRVQTPLSTLT